MAEHKRDLRPIQVFLDTRRFIDLEEERPGGGSKDFFQANDQGFTEHKTRVRTRLESVAENMRRRKQPGGFIKVRQREEALEIVPPACAPLYPAQPVRSGRCRFGRRALDSSHAGRA